MTEHQTTLYTLLAVLAILVIVMLYNNSRAKREATDPLPRLPEADEDHGIEDAWLLKFVRHGGNIVGETVARDGDLLILKQAGVFKTVPKAMATIAGDEVVLAGDIDWEASIADGTRWHEAHTKGRDVLVTEHLTRSEDVRNPALKVLKDRDEEE